MGFNKSNNASYQKKTTDQPRVTVEMLRSVRAVVRNIRQVADNCLTFTLRLDGIDLYSMRLVEGQKGTFISPPATKGKDGSYYDNYRIYMDDAASKAVEAAVRKAYDENMTECGV